MVGMSCVICGNLVPLYCKTTICTECLNRLHKVLYPEQHKEDLLKPILDLDLKEE